MSGGVARNVIVAFATTLPLLLLVVVATVSATDATIPPAPIIPPPKTPAPTGPHGMPTDCNRSEPYYVLDMSRSRWGSPGYAYAKPGTMFDTTPKNPRAWSLSMWVNLTATQNSDGCFFNLIPNRWGYPRGGPFNNSIRMCWNNGESRLEVYAQTNNGTTNKIAGGSSVVRVNTGHWRLVTLVVDGVNGKLSLYADTVLELVSSFPELTTEGIFQTNSANPSYNLGCQASGLNCIKGQLGDVTLISRAVTSADLQHMFQFRMWTDSGCGFGDETYPSDVVGAWRFAPYRRFTAPGSYVNWNSYVVRSHVNLKPRFVTLVNMTGESWNATERKSYTCGATQSASVKMPGTFSNWEVSLVILVDKTATIPTNPSPQLVVRSRSDNKLLGMKDIIGGNGNHHFYMTFYRDARETSLDFEISVANTTGGGAASTFASWCVAHVIVAEMENLSLDTGEYTLPGIVFRNTPTKVTILGGLPANAKIAFHPMGTFSSYIDCPGIEEKFWITPSLATSPTDPQTVYYKYFMTPDQFPRGMYGICVYPTGVVDGQTYFARGDNQHASSLLVVSVPAIASPVPKGWLSSLLHLGDKYDSLIPHGLMTTDYFRSVGGDQNIKPAIGDTLMSTAGQNLSWTPTTTSNGIWGQVPNTTNNWIQYFALGIYAPASQSIAFTSTHCGSFDLWVNGKGVYLSRDCISGYKASKYITIPQGWSQLVMKLHKRVGDSYMSLRVDQGYGLAWNFAIPRDSNGQPIVANYSDMCSKTPSFNGALSCMSSGVNVSEGECYDLGCCYDASAPTENLKCYAPANGRQTWRPDGRCGVEYPAAATNVSQCNPSSSMEATCCSAHHWCGNSTQHCNCPTCINYKYSLNKKKRCTYKLWGAGASCPRIAQQTLAGVFYDEACREECDFTPGCKGYARGINSHWRKGPSSCTLYFEDCAHPELDLNTSSTYRAFCDDCGFTETCTSCKCPVTWYSYFYDKHVSQETCENLCSMNNQCSGTVTTASGDCRFMQEECPRPYTNTSNSADVVTTYSCKGDNATAPKPLPPQYDGNYSTDSYTHIGCFNDHMGEMLSKPKYNMNMMNSSSMTVEKCFNFCDALGTRFFSLYNGTRCSCGVRYKTGLFPMDPNVHCAMKCPGNASETCGSSSYSMLYQIPLRQGICDNGYTIFNNNCYKYVGADGNNWLNWTDAYAACRKEGAVLTGIRDEAENQYLVALPFIYNESNTRIIWAGSRDLGNGEGFTWADGWAYNFTDWRAGEPNGGGWTTDVEECLEIFSNYPTPYKGSWNDRRCNMPYPYVCEKRTNNSEMIGVPKVKMAISEGSLSCVDINDDVRKEDLVGWWALDSLKPNVPADHLPTLPDKSSKNRPFFFTYNETAAGPTNKPKPKFATGVINNALLFNGLTYLESHDEFNLKSGTATLAMWVRPTSATGTSILISKSMEDPVTTGNFVSQFAWALTQEQGKFCFHVAQLNVCTDNAVATTNWQHVSGTFDGVFMRLFVDGEEAAMQQLYSSVRVPDSPLGVVIGYRWAQPYEPFYIFRGMMDDVRVYDASLSPSEVKFLASCTPDGSPGNMINLYEGSTTTLTLFGDALSIHQRVGLSASGNCDGTPIVNHGIRVYPNHDGTDSASVYFYKGALADPGTYALCSVSPVDPEVFDQPTGLMIGVTTVRAINGSLSVTENATNFPISLQLQGVNIGDGQIIAVAMHPTCNHLLSIRFISAASANRTTGLITVQMPHAATDVLYLCWASSATAVTSSGNSASGHSGYTTENAFNTGLQVLINSPTGLRMKRFATVSGSKNLGTSAFTNGVFYSRDNYVLPCADGISFGDNFFVMISMGLFTDYLIPNKNVTVCQLLTQRTQYYHTKGLWSYSPVNPLSTLFDGSVEQVPRSTGGKLGGSPQYFPNDGREYLSAWGSYYRSNVGGCCANKVNQIPEWYQGYTLIVASLPDNLFLNIPVKPTVVFNFFSLFVHAKVVDVHGQVIDTPVTFTVTIAGTNNKYTYVESVPCKDGRLEASLNFGETKPIDYGDGFKITVKVDQESIQNGASQTWDVAVYGPPQLPASGLSGGNYLTNFLHFGSPKLSIPATYWTTSLSHDWFSRYGGEANIQPTNGDVMTAGTSVTAQWQPISNPSGKWTFDNTSKTTRAVQFFAGALYSAAAQDIVFKYSVDDAFIMYIDGKQAVKADRVSVNATAKAIPVTSGWHQVVIKFVQHYGKSNLAIQVFGNGLAWRTELPPDVPQGATTLLAGSYFDELLHLGNDLSDGFTGSFDQDYLQSEALASPKVDEMSGALTWTHMTAVDNEWVLPAATIEHDAMVQVQYFAVAVYSAVEGVISTEVSFSGPTRVFWDGKVIFSAADAFAKTTRSFDINVTTGWHQFLFKLASTATTANTFKVRVLQSNCDLSWAMQIPVTLPKPAQLLKGNLDHMLFLRNGKSAYAIPYDPTNSTSDIDKLDFNLTKAMPITSHGVVDVSIFNDTYPFSWMPMKDLDATWSWRQMGGSFNMYWSVALYASADMTNLPAMAIANKGFAMWLDGQLIKTTEEFDPSGTRFAIPDFKKGWHTLVLKLKAPNDLRMVSISPTTTYAEAHTKCHDQQLQMCDSSAFCPYWHPRPGTIPLAGNRSTFVPIRDRTNSWLQIGKEANNTKVCETWSKAHRGWTPSWGTSDQPQNVRHIMGCCGSFVPPEFSLQFFPDASKGDNVGWAFEVPAKPLSPPVITIDNPRKVKQLVTITTNDPNARIIYTTNGRRPSYYYGYKYDGAFNVSYSTTIMAIAVTSPSRVSRVATKVVQIRRFITFTRTVAVANTRTVVGFTGVMAGYKVAFVPSSNTTSLTRLASSSKFAENIPATSTYSGVLTIDEDLDVIVPPLRAENYTAIVYPGFNANGQAADAGVVLRYNNLEVQTATVSPKHAFNDPSVAFSVRGGAQGGDAFQFLDLLMGSDAGSRGLCTDDQCMGAFSNTNFPPFYGLDDTSLPEGEAGAVFHANLTGFTGTLTCLCYSGRGDGEYHSPSEFATAIPVDIIVVKAPITPAPPTTTAGPTTEEPATSTHPVHTNTEAPGTTEGPATPTPSGRVITVGSISPSVVADAETLTINGKFFDLDRHHVQVDFQRPVTTKKVAGEVVPLCTVTSVSSTRILCTVRTDAGIMGEWNVVVHAADPTTYTPPRDIITIKPPAPKILAAGGSCVKQSKMCTTGAVVHFSGYNFNTKDRSMNAVEFFKNSVRSTDVSCRVTDVTTNVLSCQLVVSKGTEGNYDVRVIVNVTSTVSIVEDSHAALVFGKGDSPGWNGAAMAPTPAPHPDDGHGGSDDKDKKIDSWVIGVIAALAGLVLVGIIAVAYTKSNYRLVEREPPQGSEMDYIEEQLLHEANRRPGPENRSPDSPVAPYQRHEGIEVDVPPPKPGTENASAAEEQPTAADTAHVSINADAGNGDGESTPPVPEQQDLGRNM